MTAVRYCACGRLADHKRDPICHTCYERWRRKNPVAQMSVEELFFHRVRVDPDSDCWIWVAAKDPKGGYGKFVSERFGIVMPAHRWSYEYMRAPIPTGLVIDHLCRNPPCVNPWHLEPVTIAVNSLRGEAPAIKTWRTGTCPRGHSMADALEVKTGRYAGRRNCRTCNHLRWAEKAKNPAFRAAHAAKQRERQRRRREAA
jgi:hypothetical protein